MALLLGGANVAFAEESGGFVGIGIGGGGTEFKENETHETNDKRGYTNKLGGINYGFVAGYKQFLTPYLGLRYYASLDLHHNLKKTEGERADITLLNYGVNVDFLGNFISTEIADFGGFIGIGIGANSLTGKDIKLLKDSIKENGWKFNDTAFDVWLNLGLRTNIATNHGIELVARVLFLPVKMVDIAGVDGTANYKYKITFGQTYSVLARYTFSF